MADYVDYNAFAAANAEEEERLLGDAYARAEEADKKARLALGKARAEATGSYDEKGQLVGGTDDITQTGSFSDFVQFQREAEVARLRAQQAYGEDPRRQALRRDMAKRDGTSGRLDAMSDSLEEVQARASNSLRGQMAGREKLRAEAAERNRIADEKKAARDKEAADFRDKYNKDLADRIRKGATDWPNQFNQQRQNELSYLWQASGRASPNDTTGEIDLARQYADNRMKGIGDAMRNKGGGSNRWNNDWQDIKSGRSSKDWWTGATSGKWD